MRKRVKTSSAWARERAISTFFISMPAHSTYFPGVQEVGLSEGARTALRCMLQALLDSPPSNVAPNATFVRSETGGSDFILPHSMFEGFGIVVRVGSAAEGAEIAYSKCKRPDRGDEFDAAFDPARKGIIAKIEQSESFGSDLIEVLREYLHRKLCVVRRVRHEDGAVVSTRILWPSGTGNAEGGARTLWSQRKMIGLLRVTEEKVSAMAFDEPAS
jgi:hypothetical protein